MAVDVPTTPIVASASACRTSARSKLAGAAREDCSAKKTRPMRSPARRRMKSAATARTVSRRLAALPSSTKSARLMLPEMSRAR